MNADFLIGRYLHSFKFKDVRYFILFNVVCVCVCGVCVCKCVCLSVCLSVFFFFGGGGGGGMGERHNSSLTGMVRITYVHIDTVCGCYGFFFP